METNPVALHDMDMSSGLLVSPRTIRDLGSSQLSSFNPRWNDWHNRVGLARQLNVVNGLIDVQ